MDGWEGAWAGACQLERLWLGVGGWLNIPVLLAIFFVRSARLLLVVLLRWAAVLRYGTAYFRCFEVLWRTTSGGKITDSMLSRSHTFTYFNYRLRHT